MISSKQSPKPTKLTGDQYLIKQVDHDIIIKRHALPLFYILLPPRQYSRSIVDLTGFQKTFKVARVKIVYDSQLMLNILRVVGVGTVGPVGGGVFQITQHVVITDMPTSIPYRRRPTILSVASVNKKL